MEFLRSFLRRHLAGEPVVASLNVGCQSQATILVFPKLFSVFFWKLKPGSNSLLFVGVLLCSMPADPPILILEPLQTASQSG